ncbi:type VI secretion system contractile sheath large subunit, partial [Lysobacter sp. 2RAB21]
MANTESQAAPAAAVEAAEGGLLEQILIQTKIAKTDTERARARDLMAELVAQVTDGALVVSKDAITALDARIAEIDRLLSDQLSAVMH